MLNKEKDQHEILGYINSIESFGAVDGPGIRFVVFMQGCNMRCQYCHNPETWNLKGGTARTAQDVFDQAYRFRSYWKKNGGITVSGGEALLQIDFVTELFRIAKEKGVNTTLDTSGGPFTRKEPFFSKFLKLLEVTDLFLLDIKQIDDGKHRKLTGFTNENILELAEFLSEKGKEIWIRHVLVPGITTDEEDLRKLASFIKTLKTVTRIDVLPYHALGVPKWEKLGIPYSLSTIKAPTIEQIERAKKILDII